MNRRNFFRYLAAVPAAFVPGCFSPGLPAADKLEYAVFEFPIRRDPPVPCYVPSNADEDELIHKCVWLDDYIYIANKDAQGRIIDYDLEIRKEDGTIISGDEAGRRSYQFVNGHDNPNPGVRHD